MRYQIIPSKLDIKNYYVEIYAKKHLKTRKLLKDAEADIINLCTNYATTLKKLSTPKIQAWDEETSEALKSCYTVSTEALSAHKDAILANLKSQSEINVQRCAYCMLNDPKTWDHYMPKDHFPEYAIFHENLLYVCFGCNQRKWNYFDVNHLIFCHPYFTVDSTEALLHCKVNIVNGKLSIGYYGAGTGKLKLAGEILHRHIVKLGLVEKFKGEAAGTIGGLIGELRQYYPKGVSKNALEIVLERRYSEARERLGCNAWDSRLWHGLAACNDFLAYANAQITLASAPSSHGFRKASPPP